jgi:arylsulfatase
VPNKPNILVLFTDMQRADTIHALGNPVISTPNLDRLVAEGTSFTNTFSPSPVCVPARCCMHYGLYPQGTGLYENGEMMEDNNASYPGILARAGYRTHGIGKVHFTPDQQALRGFQTRESQEEIMVDPDTDNYTAYLKDNGFDYVEPHGFRGEMYYIPQVSRLPIEAHPTQWVGDRSIDFIEQNSGKEPWLLYTSFIHPHPPFSPPTPWHKLYRAWDMPLPNVPIQFEALQTHINRVQNRYKFRDQGIDLNLMRNIKAFYYATISFIDYQVGRIIEVLEKQGVLDNTLVVFSSDHGEYLGDYECFGKRSMHDASSRVPLIVRQPERFAFDTRCDTPASLIDLFPTFTAAAGVDATQYSVDGVDLYNLASGKSDRDAVFSQFSSGPTGNYMIATRNHKYFYSAPDDIEFLFDRKTDPLETRNRANTPFLNEVQEKLKSRLLSFLNQQGEVAALHESNTGLDWQRYPYSATISPNPDDGLLVQDGPGSVVPIPGYTTSRN